MPIRSKLPLSITLILCLLLLSPAFADQSAIPQVHDFQRLAIEANQKKLPIVLLISQYHCGYCDRMKEEVLYPMSISGDFEQTALVRELLIDEGEMVNDFQGNRVAASAFSQRYSVFVTPTLLFLDSRGEEAAERILGINTMDYLLFYILNAAETAAEKLTDI
ncbi:MAG: thioredoxin fold domain-containing protein [Candidatus Thiodiazotropha lotti]|uniref:Thioredoxin fold domain-containing protein n=1 Tax=Candidatus Thiodiazotropha lotti TaxID=2792787 RepID=A0A9E4K408_9GAMM|nr:thioredoxin fold domain-containing protein [Candidatus Thiodiazotropha lotti]MCG7920106.1 thioredoxin fold domain-containing protein [Candidatus Thiodiazotropha lotti]MCG7928473.1 thioredoxin fold domain-containing protein [Candidatus Thiodiazotropha lotti]MCG7938276.1 thioredoxin fold domain-containing protein [Candidatus Thiodiazotropha lotti]MCG8002450.1 thioredoxin fold domain-containing protein [Candidatus Thiodiazotropha lotti]